MRNRLRIRRGETGPSRAPGYTDCVMPLLFLLLCLAVSLAAQPPAHDSRNTHIRHTDTRYAMREYARAAWQARAAFLRKQILFSAGLLPLPEKTPLNPRSGGMIAHEDYSVENVLLETYPGYYLGGNLYRPAGKTGPFPAVVSPHGHWRYGRFENTELVSVPARAVNLARQGYVVFTYDMAGWNDTLQVPHGFAGPREELWLVGTLGVQLWNGIRVVDYLQSLPEVNARRIAATGASGGATQTFLLAAVDARIGCAAPVNMVSFQMQGGSVCENAPLLRIDTHNVELAALFAPKPMMLTAATGDWTVNTPREEFPAVQSIYRLFAAAANVETQQFDSPHNYHRGSREAVYRFFGKHILGGADASRFQESAVRPDGAAPLLNLFNRTLPENALSLDAFIRQRIAAAEAATLRLAPRDAQTLARAKREFRQRLRLALLAESPADDDIVFRAEADGRLAIGRRSAADRIPAKLWNADAGGTPTLMVFPGGSAEAASSELGRLLLAAGGPLLAIDAFQTGAAAAPRDIAGAGRFAEKYFRVFNRTDDANRVQDILTALAFLRKQTGAETVNLIAAGRAGLWAVPAAALDERPLQIAADLNGFDASNDAQYIENLSIPGLRRAGDFRAAAALLASRRAFLHHAHEAFPSAWYEAAFAAAGNPDGLAMTSGEAPPRRIVDWLQGR